MFMQSRKVCEHVAFCCPLIAPCRPPATFPKSHFTRNPKICVRCALRHGVRHGRGGGWLAREIGHPARIGGSRGGGHRCFALSPQHSPWRALPGRLHVKSGTGGRHTSKLPWSRSSLSPTYWRAWRWGSCCFSAKAGQLAPGVDVVSGSRVPLHSVAARSLSVIGRQHVARYAISIKAPPPKLITVV